MDSEIKIEISTQTTKEEQIIIKQSLCITRKTFCIILFMLLIVASIGLNIYWGITIYETKELFIKKQVFYLNQFCQIQSYQISLSQTDGVTLNSNPNCSKANFSSRLLQNCAILTPTGQCLYCSQINSLGNCISYTNKGPNFAIPGQIQLWIKCDMVEVQVIEYGILRCDQVGLKDFVVDGNSNNLSASEIVGISIGSICGVLLILGCCCCWQNVMMLWNQIFSCFYFILSKVLSNQIIDTIQSLYDSKNLSIQNLFINSTQNSKTLDNY